MHIYRLETIGSLDGLVAGEEAPDVPSAGEVLIRVKASALNFRDLAILLGKSPFPIPVRAGVVPISDAAGEVEAVGADVSTGRIWWAHFEFTRINVDVITTSSSSRSAARRLCGVHARHARVEGGRD